MPENSAADVPATPAASAAQEQRIAQLKRAFQRLLKRKPTIIEQTAMQRAAQLTARAEQAARDPNVSLDDVVRIDGAAARARAKLIDMIGVRRETKNGPTLAEYLAQREAAE